MDDTNQTNPQYADLQDQLSYGRSYSLGLHPCLKRRVICNEGGKMQEKKSLYKIKIKNKY